MKTKMLVWISIATIRFDRKSFLSTLLSFARHWEYKHYDEHIGQKISLNSFPILDKIP